MIAKKIIQFCFIGICFLGVVFKGSAQIIKKSVKDILVAGRILSRNIPLEKVNVSVLGKEISSFSNTDGYFVLTCSRGATIVLSKAGFKDFTFVSTDKISNIELIPALIGTGDADEIFLPSGTRTKRDITGFTSSVKATTLAQVPMSSINNFLAGRISGVYIQQTGSAPGLDAASIQIRGQSTYNTGNVPMVIVDGVVRDFQNIDISEIESITVLKDATTLAWYGINGANAVLLVTTKKGAVQKMTIQFDAQSGIQVPSSYTKPINSYQFVSLYNKANINDGTPPVYSQDALNNYLNDTDHYHYPDNNYIDTFFKPFAFTQRYTLSVTGGTPKFKYFTLLGYFNQDGLFNHTETPNYNSNVRFNRLNFRANIDFEVNPNLKASLLVTGRSENRIQPGGNLGGLMNVINNTPPNAYPLVNPNGTFGGSSSFNSNPYVYLQKNGYVSNSTQVMNSTFKVNQNLDSWLTGLSANILFSYDAQGIYKSGYSQTGATYNLNGGGYGTNSPLNYLSPGYTSNLSKNEFWGGFDYNHLFKFKHKIDASIRFERDQQTQLTDLPSRTQEMATRIDYAYDNKYYATFVASYSGSDVFAADRRYGFFPSIGLGWIVTEEKFLKPNKILSYLKIHGSYGKVGNDQLNAIRRFPFQSVFNYSSAYVFGTGYSSNLGVAELNIGNPNITWENLYQTNIGLEIMLLNRALDIDVNLFSDTRKNILTTSVLPDILGQQTSQTNSGSVQSKGFEVSFNYNKVIGAFRINLMGNYTLALNKILYINEGYIPQSQSQIGHTVGMPISATTKLLYVSDGLFQDSTQLANGAKISFAVLKGDIRYKDTNGDGIVDATDRQMTDYTDVPKAYFGFGANIGYKRFDFSFQFQGAIGRTVPINQAVLSGGYNIGHFATDRWTPDNAGNALWPRLAINSRPNNTLTSDFYYRNGDYLKLKSLEFGYTLPFSLKGKEGANSVRFYLSGNNILSFSNLKSFGLDPENPLAGWGTNYPYLSVYAFGASLRF